MNDKQNLLNEHIKVLFDDSSLRNVFERSNEDVAAKKRRELRDILRNGGSVKLSNNSTVQDVSIDVPISRGIFFLD